MSNDDMQKYYRKPWMSDDQWQCAVMFADVVGGFHHIFSEFKPCGRGVKIHHSGGGWATWDYNRLTRLIVLAHDRMIRVELIPSGPGRLGFAMWQRKSRDGGCDTRHPTIEDAIAMHRPKQEAARQ